MPRILASPRRRRRLARLGAVVVIAGGALTAALVVPEPKAPQVAPPKNAPPAQVTTHSTKVTRSERRAINATLDKFLGAALNRKSLATAWQLAGPELKAGSTLRQWRAGTSPIPYFPTREKTFHDWTSIDAGPRYVVFDHLLVHPRNGPKTSSWIFSGEVVKRDSRWLVNRLYTIAIMQKPTKSGTHQVGPNDFAAAAAVPPGAQQTTGAALGKQWLLLAAGLIGLVLLFPLGFGIASAVRSRRHRRQYGRPAERELPPLPRTFEAAASGAAEKGPAGERRH
jgi:hypothetical protein